MAHAGGRPLKFKTVKELQTKIDAYFDNTPKDEWTWTGLALELDTDRETLSSYKKRPEFSDSVKRALLKVQNQYEIDLRKRGHAGNIFALKNFGWKDKQDVNFTDDRKIVADLFPKDIEEKDKDFDGTEDK